MMMVHLYHKKSLNLKLALSRPGKVRQNKRVQNRQTEFGLSLVIQNGESWKFRNRGIQYISFVGLDTFGLSFLL